MIDNSKLSDMLDRISLPDLVERETRVELKKAGKEFRGPCPIHGGDNHTAFSVFQNGTDRWLWHCHTTCNSGGDALTFIRRVRNLDFVEAVKWMCDYTRTPFELLGLTEQAITEHKERERRRDVLDLAAQFYVEQFRANQAALDYVRGRAFNDDTIKAAGFGYSHGTGLAQWLKEKNADMETARQTGLVRADGLDFTANANGATVSPEGWLVYVHRAGGRVDYLSARALNTETDDKSRNLPGTKKIYRADVRGDAGLVIAEGQADAESWRQLGYSAWALCGTSLTDADAAAIRNHKAVVIFLDNDGAGNKRTSDVARAIGPLVMIAPPLPGGCKDGNDWLKSGGDSKAAAALLKQSRPLIDLFIEESAYVPAYDMDERVGVVAGLIALIPDTLQGSYLKKAEKALGVPVRDLKARMKQSGSNDYCFSEIRNGMLHFRREPLCNWAGIITEQLTVDDGSNMPAVRYTVKAKLAEGKPLPDVEIDAEEFEAVPKWMARNWGADAILFIPPSQAYQISRAIKELSRASGMKRETIHTYTGWATVNGKRAYLTASGAISADGFDPNVRVNLGHNRLAYYKLPAPPDDPATLKKAIKWSLGFLSLSPRRVTVPLWAAMYGAPLMSMFSLNAVLWPYGPTQSGKSTLTMLALAHFGEQFIKGRDYQAPKDWMSTITDLEGAMFATKDIPLVIDDFAPQFTGVGESRDMHKKAHNVVRSVGNRSSRGRANADLSERMQRPPRGMVIGTAELPLTGQSIVGRMIYVPFERGDVPFSSSEPGMLDWAQEAAGPGQGMYSLAMAGYVQWLAANWDQVLSEAKADHERANQYARTVFPSTQSRLMDYYAALYTYSRVPLRYFAHVGAEHPDVLNELSKAVIPAALVEVLSSQSKRVAGQSPVIRLFEALGDLMMNRKAHLNPRDTDAPAPPLNSTLIGWYGVEDNGKREIYIRLTQCIGLVKDYLTRAGESFDVSTDSLQREIWQAGLLTRRGGSEYTISVWVREEKKTVRCLAIDASRLPDMGVGDLWPVGPETSENGQEG